MDFYLKYLLIWLNFHFMLKYLEEDWNNLVLCCCAVKQDWSPLAGHFLLFLHFIIFYRLFFFQHNFSAVQIQKETYMQTIILYYVLLLSIPIFVILVSKRKFMWCAILSIKHWSVELGKCSKGHLWICANSAAYLHTFLNFQHYFFFFRSFLIFSMSWHCLMFWMVT